MRSGRGTKADRADRRGDRSRVLAEAGLFLVARGRFLLKQVANDRLRFSAIHCLWTILLRCRGG
jgi:hypothetical protein